MAACITNVTPVIIRAERNVGPLRVISTKPVPAYVQLLSARKSNSFLIYAF